MYTFIKFFCSDQIDTPILCFQPIRDKTKLSPLSTSVTFTRMGRRIIGTWFWVRAETHNHSSVVSQLRTGSLKAHKPERKLLESRQTAHQAGCVRCRLGASELDASRLMASELMASKLTGNQGCYNPCAIEAMPQCPGTPNHSLFSAALVPLMPNLWW